MFEAIYGLIQFVNPQIGILWLANPERAAHGTIIYKNQYASLLNMIWPLALASGILPYVNAHKKDQGKSIGHRLKEKVDQFSTANLQAPLMIFAAGIMILAILFSLSRGGILAMVLVALMLLIILPFSKAGKIGCLVLFVCLIVGYGTVLGLDTIVTRFDSLDNSGAHRLTIYLASLPMFWDHWLTGIGIGSYALLSPLYLKGFPTNILYDRVHNEYLELLIELGLPAAILLFGWILIGVLKLLVGLSLRQKHQEIDLNRRVLGTAAFCGVAGFLIHGLADFGWRLPVNLVYCATLLAICVCSQMQRKAPDGLLKKDLRELEL
ncbi:MAG: O-antigen ligase family protein [Desulfobulbaceae bacterium]|nr:O-antigen ligase family protein [Desulfobulbaceae bacterium]